MQYTYDANSRLAQVTGTRGGQSTTSTYSYDSRGTRVSVESGNQRTTYLTDYLNPTGYSQTLVETVLDVATGQIIKQIAYAIGFDQISQTTTTYNPDGSVATVTTEVLHTDAHGSTRALTNLAGQLIEAYAYQAYGELLEIFNASSAALHSATLTSVGSGSPGSETIASSARTSYLYAGEAWDVGASAYYNRARFYQPGTGRFLGLDPYAGNQSNPQSFHKYGYTHGDPVNGIDPTGLEFSIVSLAVNFATRLSVVLPIVNAVSLGYSAAKIGYAVGTILRSAIIERDLNWKEDGSQLASAAYETAWTLVGLYGLNVYGLRAAAGAFRAGFQRVLNVAMRANGSISPSTLRHLQGGASYLFGRLAELYIAFIYNSWRNGATLGRYVPDFISGTVIREVKNVAKLAYDRQLQAFVKHAKDTGKKLVIHVRKDTDSVDTAADLLEDFGPGSKGVLWDIVEDIPRWLSPAG